MYKFGQWLIKNLTIFNFGPMKLKFGTRGYFGALITNFNSEFPLKYILISKSAFSFILGKGCSYKMVSMATMKHLSLFFFLPRCQQLMYMKDHQVSRKKYLSFQSYPRKTKRREESSPPRGFSRIMLEQKIFFS